MYRSDAHRILGTNDNTTPEELKKAHRRLAAKWHPDKNPDKVAEATKRFQEIQEAYETITGDRKASSPNQGGAQRPGYQSYTANSQEEMEEILKRFREHGFGFQFKPEDRPKPDDISEEYSNNWGSSGPGAAGVSGGHRRSLQILNAQIVITLEEAFKGCTKEINIPDPAKISGAPTQLTIPPGLREGEVFRVIETPTQTVRCFIKIVSEYRMVVPNHPFGNLINQGGGDIMKELSVSPFLMMQGGFVEVKCIDGTAVSIRVPAGLEANQTLRIQGKGYWLNKSCEHRGDVYLRIIPTIQKIDDIPITDDLKSFVEIMREKIAKAYKV